MAMLGLGPVQHDTRLTGVGDRRVGSEIVPNRSDGSASIAATRCRSFGVHHVQNAVDDLVTPGPENGGTQDFLIVGIDQHLHVALGLALFDGAADAGHRASADQRRLPAASYLILRQTGSAERRINVERVSDDTVAEPAGVVAEQIRGDNLEIVIGRVRKGTSAVAVAERPDPGTLVRSWSSMTM